MNILICDDEQSRRDGWKTRLDVLLGTKHHIELLGGKDFMDCFHELTKRREHARERRVGTRERLPLGDLPEKDDWTETTFDRADVLLVDYDLFAFQPNDYLTGAIVAYLVRCYSGCRTIVGVNELGTNPFDLTLLDTPHSFADLTIGETQLDNPGLWFGRAGGAPADGFRPWYWPALLDMPERQRRCCDTAFARLEDHVLDVTGLDAVYDRLPRSAIGWLERADNTEERTTLDDLARGTRPGQRRSDEAHARGARLGYRRGDEASSRESVARVAAARAAKWMETVVLPLQDVLIDAPHLVQRNAALLDVDDVNDLATADWEVTTRVPATHKECGLRAEVLDHRHVAPDWLSRPAFYWPMISTARDLPGIEEPYKVPVVDKVFCEDLSVFLRQDQARRFVSKLDSSSPTRWIADPEASGHLELLEVDYQPKTRLAM